MNKKIERIGRFALAAFLSLGGASAEEAVVRVVAGGGQDDGMPASRARLEKISGLAVDDEGNVYYAERERNRVRRIDAETGLLSTVAGTGERGNSGDGGPALEAQLSAPSTLAIDRQGFLFVTTCCNPTPLVRRVDLRRGTIDTISDSSGYSLAASPDGAIYVSRRRGGIERISEGGKARSALDWVPVGPTSAGGGFYVTHHELLATNPAGDLYVGDSGRNRIVVFRAGRGAPVHVAGNGQPGSPDDGTPARNAALSVGPLAVDRTGDIYYAESGKGRVRKIGAKTGVVRTVAGTGSSVPYTFTPGRVESDRLAIGDGGLATSAYVPQPSALALDGRGRLYIADGGDRIRRVDLKTGTIQTIAGETKQNPGGDGGPATAALLSDPRGIAISPTGDLFVVEWRKMRIRIVELASGTIRSLSLSSEFPLTNYERIAFHPDGRLIAIDEYGNIFRIDPGTGAMRKVSGGGYGTRLGAALETKTLPQGIAFDRDGIAYFSDRQHRIVRFEMKTGELTAVAGTGSPGFSGDGGLATEAQLNDPYGIVADSEGTIFVADYGNGRIRRIDARTGIITTVAGNGERGFSGEGGLAVRETLNRPSALALDQDRFLFFSEGHPGLRIRRLDLATGILSTAVGSGGYVAGTVAGRPGPQTNLPSTYYGELALDREGTLFFSSVGEGRVFAVPTRVEQSLPPEPMSKSADFVSRSTSGPRAVTLVGSGRTDLGGDGWLATHAALGGPYLAVGNDASVYLAGGTRVRRIDGTTGMIDTIAGDHSGPRSFDGGYSGDGGPARAAEFKGISSIALFGNALFIADTENRRVRAVDLKSGIVTTYVGGDAGGQFGQGDGKPATEIHVWPGAIALDPEGNLYMAEEKGASRIWRVDRKTRLVSTAAGDGKRGFAGDGGPATQAQFNGIVDMALGPDGALYLSDGGNHCIRRIDLLSGVITRVVGTGEPGASGDGELALSARLNFPAGIAFGKAGDLFIADTANNVVRRVDPRSGVISTVARVSMACYGHGPCQGQTDIVPDRDGGILVLDATTLRRIDPATGTSHKIAGGSAPFHEPRPALQTSLSRPEGVAVGPKGEVVVADTGHRVLRRFDPDTGEAQSLQVLGDPHVAPHPGTRNVKIYEEPSALTFDPGGALWAVERGKNRVWRIDTGGSICLFAGVPDPGFRAEVPEVAEEGIQVAAVAVDAGGNVYLADASQHRVWRADQRTRALTLIAGNGRAGFSGDGGAATSAALNLPRGLAVFGSSLFVADAGNDRIRRIDLTAGTIETVTGVGAQLRSPTAVAVDRDGNLFIADTGNDRIARVDARTGVIETVLGPEDGIAYPQGLAVDVYGTLFVSSTGRNVVVSTP